ncbi:MAG: glycosyltransferase [Chitinophagaceae bacterium]|nr:MAG: glycosyltransferase [Chitinophagaceae bacterium]
MARAPSRKPAGMKILSLVWFKVLPARFGGQKGTALFTRALAEQVPLVCLCASDNEPDGPLPYRLRPELPPGRRSVARPPVWRHIAQVVQEEAPTHLLLEYPYHAYAAVRAARRFGLKLVLHEHNIEYRRFRGLRHPAWRLLKAYERWACRQADLVLFKTEADRRHALETFGLTETRTMIVPYGIDAPRTVAPEEVAALRRRWNIPVGARVFLFAATLDYLPNAEALRALYREVAPRLDTAGAPYRIIVCGRNRSAAFQDLEALQHPAIIRAGEVPELAPYYAAADAFLNPVLGGGGVQTKVIDALAHRCPVLSFAFGAQGIDRGLCGEALRTVPNGDWDAIVQALQESVPASVPDAFFHHYAWPEIARRVISRLKNEPA